MGKFDLYGNYTVDPLLRSRRELVTQIVSMVDHPEDLELSVAAMRIVQDMAVAAPFNPLPGSPHKLFTILEDAGALPAAHQAFINRLEREEDERIRLLSPENIQALFESDGGAAFEFGLANIVRLQILDFLIQNCAKPGFNLAHYLLGFDSRRGVKESVLDESQDNCLFLVLDILDYGLGKPDSPVVFHEHPSLAAKGYELIWNLLSGKTTNKPLMKLFSTKSSRFFDFVSRHFNKLSIELLGPTDVYTTAHELKAKASLFNAYALDLNIAVQYRKQSISIDDKRIAGYLKAMRAAVASSMISAEDQYEYSAAVTMHVQAISRLLQTCILADCSTSLISVVLIGLLQCLRDQDLTLEARESVAAVLLLSVTNGHANAHPESVSAVVATLCQTESSLVLRSYLYSCFCALPRPLILDQIATVKGSAGRLAETAVKDITAPGTGLEAWKTLAASFLAQLVTVLPSLIQELAQTGFLKAIVQSLRGDEAAVTAFLDASGQAPNALFLWKSKLSLLKAMAASSSTALELLVGAGILDQLTGLSLIDRIATSETDDGLVRSQFYEIIEPVLSLVVLAARQNSELKHSQVHRGLLQFISGHFDLISRQLVLKTGPKAHCALLSHSAELVDYAGPELVPVAAKHGISLRHVVTNMLIKALLAMERDLLPGEASEVTTVSLELCSHSLQFIASSRLQNAATSPALVDFDDLPADKLTVEGKMPITIIERLLLAFNHAIDVPALHQVLMRIVSSYLIVRLHSRPLSSWSLSSSSTWRIA